MKSSGSSCTTILMVPISGFSHPQSTVHTWSAVLNVNSPELGMSVVNACKSTQEPCQKSSCILLVTMFYVHTAFYVIKNLLRRMDIQSWESLPGAYSYLNIYHLMISFCIYIIGRILWTNSSSSFSHSVLPQYKINTKG